MDIAFETIIFYLVLLDAVVANVVAWSGARNKINRKLGLFSRYFPITRGWTTYYLVLVLWVGYGLLRLGML